MNPLTVQHTSKQYGAVDGAGGGRRETRSRSPHPYRRRGNSLLVRTNSRRQLDESRFAGLATRPSTSNSSESGTEADDERGGSYLKVLPAPPLRGRKGLRGATPEKHTPAVSPLPTPPLVEDVATSYFTTVSPPKKEPAPAEGQRQDVLEKYTKRKRAEVTRRGLETLLLLSIGLITYQQASTAASLQNWGPEIAGFLFAVTCLCLAYPLRISWTYLRLWKTPVYAFRRGFHIPSRFDPGALLYPVFVPPFVAASLFRGLPDPMLPNMILGLSSLPPLLVPCSPYTGVHRYLHWAFSLSPLVAARLTESFSAAMPPTLRYKSQGSVTLETLTLLQPLHDVLVPTLNFLVTTSLDPAELQLLAVALINLFLFAASPQAEILKSLLWLGGVMLFLSCRQVLAWEVTLARIPNWRFRREKRKLKSGWGNLDIRLCRQLRSLASSRKLEVASAGDDSSDDSPFQPLLKLQKTLTLDVYQSPRSTANGQPQSAAEISSFDLLRNTPKTTPRRNTFSAEETRGRLRKTTAGGFLKRLPIPSLTGFLRLTSSQAWVRRQMYALYTYTVVLVVILLPIRLYVRKHALSQNEPFGWALAYLFGNIPQFRFQVVYHSLERWIRLPILQSEEPASAELRGLVYTRQVQLGPANTRLAICAYCVVVLLTGITSVLHLTSVVEVDTRRKVFHGIMVAMLLPTIFVDPCFIALALALILAIFLLLDLFRASQLPPISRPLTNFLAPYVDGRDHRGPIIVSHIFLLIGCAIPLWLSLAGLPRTGSDPWAGWEVTGRDLSMVSGVVCVGMGDAAASLVGRRYGRTKWCWGGGKSLQGTVAFTVAVTVGLTMSYTWLILGGWKNAGDIAWITILWKVTAAAAGASMTETLCTSANDNVIVPLTLWLMVRGLDI